MYLYLFYLFISIDDKTEYAYDNVYIYVCIFVTLHSMKNLQRF